jgi:heme/copper-type cytochrome/quinol oxidase subunit 3
VDFSTELLIGLHSILGTLSALIISYAFFILSELFIFLSLFSFLFNHYLGVTAIISIVGGEICLYLMIFPFALAFSNLLILLYSSLGFQSALIFCKSSLRIKLLEGLGHTFMAGFLFLSFQFYEYVYCFFAISDSFFASIFFATTGLHGLHVFLGTLAISSFLILAALGYISYFESTLALHLWAYY